MQAYFIAMLWRSTPPRLLNVLLARDPREHPFHLGQRSIARGEFAGPPNACVGLLAYYRHHRSPRSPTPKSCATRPTETPSRVASCTTSTLNSRVNHRRFVRSMNTSPGIVALSKVSGETGEDQAARLPDDPDSRISAAVG